MIQEYIYDLNELKLFFYVHSKSPKTLKPNKIASDLIDLHSCVKCQNFHHLFF